MSSTQPILKALFMPIYRFVKFGFSAGVVLFLFILLINNYFRNVEDYIHADGVGYYDYLPSIFIRHDLDRKDKLVAEAPELYKGVMGYPDYHGRKLNKYACGTAILMSPFFAYAYATTPLEGNEKDGYQKPFHKKIFHATIFYLLLSLLLLRAILERYGVRMWIIFLMQLLLGLGTTVTHYAHVDAAYSHVYSLFAISLFIYCAVCYFQDYQSRHLVGMLAALGLVVIIRQMNVLIVLLLPYLAGSWPGLKKGITSMLSDYKWLAVGLAILLSICAIQSLMWYYQVGEFLTYSYGEEGFNFATPRLFKVLFSYQKGLFVYTPVLLIALSGVLWMLISRRIYQALTWSLFFVVQTYVLASWWCWWLGCSYGMRSYIDIYVVFFIPFALMLDQAKSPIKYGVILPALLCIPLNVVQTYQYKFDILDWSFMNEMEYWDIFLRTDPKYIGSCTKSVLYTDWMHIERGYKLGSVHGNPGDIVTLLEKKGDSLPDMSRISVMQIFVESDFNRECDSKFVLEMDEMDGSKWYNWSDRPLIHYREQPIGTYHRGQFPFFLQPMPATKTLRVALKAFIGSHPCPMDNVVVLLWAKD